MVAPFFKILNLHKYSIFLAFFSESLITFLVITSPPSCISLGQTDTFCLKEIGSNNNKETKLSVSYLIVDCEDLARKQ